MDPIFSSNHLKFNSVSFRVFMAFAICRHSYGVPVLVTLSLCHSFLVYLGKEVPKLSYTDTALSLFMKTCLFLNCEKQVSCWIQSIMQIPNHNIT